MVWILLSWTPLTPQKCMSLDETDAMLYSVSSGFLHLVSTVSDASRLQLSPSIKFHKLQCQVRVLLLSVLQAGKLSVSKLIH